MKYKKLSEQSLKKIVRRVILENDNQEGSDELNHKKKQFLLINNFNHLKKQPVDNKHSIDIYGKKYPNFVVFMLLIERPKDSSNYDGDNYLVKFDVKPNGLGYIKYGEEENIGKKGWISVKDLYDSEVEKYMKNAANYAEFKYEMDNMPRFR